MLRFYYILGLLIFISISFSGCKNQRVPKGFPKPDKMAVIMTEIHIIESALQYGSQSHITTKETHGYYKNILQKYGYTYEQFDSIRKWYANNPALFQKVYDKVIINISKQETELGLLLDKEIKEALRQAEILAQIEKKSELWKSKDSITISPTDTIDKRVPFYIDTDTLELLGILRLSAQYKFLYDDLSKNPQIMLTAFYADSTADTLYFNITRSFQKNAAILDLKIDTNKKTTNISGFLLWQDSLVNPSVQISSISLKNLKDSVKTEPVLEVLKEDLLELEAELPAIIDYPSKKLKEELRKELRNMEPR